MLVPVRRARIVLALIAGWMGAESIPTVCEGANPSLCPRIDSTCHVVGSRVRAVLAKGAGDPIVGGGQFSFSYDTAGLRLLSMAPGSSCDPASPFSQELFATVDEITGEAFYAVAVALGDTGSDAPVAMVCLEFAVLEPQPGGLCVHSDAGASFFVDQAGDPVFLDNSAACPGSPGEPTLSCTAVELSETCTCETGVPDCTVWDDACNVGACDEESAACLRLPTNEGGPCDDGIPCTTTDLCATGVCVGSGCVNQSLCVAADNGCQAAGGQLARVVVGAGEPVIFGGQFSLHYDAAALTLLDISPGATCDPDSPFALEIEEHVDHTTGDVFYAAGVDLIENVEGTQGPATLACLHFAANGQGQGQLCLQAGGNPAHTILVDDTGHAVQVYNDLDCPNETPDDGISCDTVTWDDTCLCTPGTDDCSALSTACRTGVCDPDSRLCRVEFANDGGNCDDGLECTTSNVCIAGTCRGFGCRNPSLCLDINHCPRLTEPGEIAIRIGAGDPVITGGQFTLSYDPAQLDFVEVVPGAECDHGSPFSVELHRVVDEQAGEIFFAVGVDPATGSGTSEATTLACVRFNGSVFTSSGACLLRGVNPFHTLLVDEHGQSIEINTFDCPGDFPDPIVTCIEFCDVPVLSTWNAIILALLMLTAAKLQPWHRVGGPPTCRSERR